VSSGPSLGGSGRSLPRAALHPAFWLTGFATWFGTLWWLSSRLRPLEHIPPIPFLDKILHFGWFCGGAGLLAAFLLRLKPAAPPSFHRNLLAIVLLAGIGALDEWHQSWVPGRSGNDPGDWIADVLGSIAGILVFRFIGHPMLTRRPIG